MDAEHAPSSKPQPNGVIAAIDVGSGALRMVIAEVLPGARGTGTGAGAQPQPDIAAIAAETGHYRILESLRMPTMLGRDSYAAGEISPETSRDCIRTLNGFQRIINEYKAGQVCAVATSALREALNRDYILDQIRVKTALNVEVLDNAVERHLTLMSLARTLDGYRKMRKEGMIIVDVGYGSSQVSAVRRSELMLSRNVRLGTMRIWEMLNSMAGSGASSANKSVMADQNFAGGQTLHFADMMEEYIIANMDHIRAMVRWQDIPHCVLLSGEADQLLHMEAGQLPGTGNATGGRIARKRFNQLYRDMKQHAGVDYPASLALSEHMGITAEHAETLLPTMMIAKSFLEMTGAEALHVARTSMVEGLLERMACDYIAERGSIAGPGTAEVTAQAHANVLSGARRQYEQSASDDTISLVRALARSQFYDDKHSGYVEQKALQLFDALAPVHALGERERLLLQLACIMHDTGKSLASPSHGAMSATIVRSSKLPGLNAAELEMVAQICQYHSAIADFPMDMHCAPDIAPLSTPQRMTTAKLTAILRLADALDKGHKQKFDRLDVAIKDNKIVVKTRCAQDATLERWFWTRKAQLFQRVFGRTAVLKVTQTTEQDKAGEAK